MTSEKPRFKFPKEERLRSKRLIEELFEKGSSFSLYPFRVLHLPHPDPVENHQVLISVPRKKFKSAVQRNRLKRRIREAYRLNKFKIATGDKATIPYMLAYIYISEEVLSSEIITEKLNSSLERLIQEWNR